MTVLQRHHSSQSAALLPMPVGRNERYALIEAEALAGCERALGALEQEEADNEADHFDRIRPLRQILRSHRQNLSKLGAEAEAIHVSEPAEPGDALSLVVRLKEQEERALSEYRQAVDEGLGEDQELLWEVLIPSTEYHIDLLEEMLSDWAPAPI